MSEILIHLWDDCQVGSAPFRHTGTVISLPSTGLAEANPAGYNHAVRDANEIARGYGVTLGSCDVCGNGIRNHHVIRNAEGTFFVVGSDCVAKTNDATLSTAAKVAEKKRQKDLRHASRERARLERLAEREVELDEQRQRNGGPTDQEIQDEKRQADEEANRAKYRVENEWLLDELYRVAYSSDFVDSMITSLERSPLDELSDRCRSILQDIYAKSAGRRNSKAYRAKADEFEGKSNG